MSVGKVNGAGMQAYTQQVQNAKAAEEAAQKTPVEEMLEAEAQRAEKRDVVAISGKSEEETRLQKWKEMLEKLEQAKNQLKVKATPPKDNSAQLTQRLVAATMQTEVRGVISDATRSLTSLRSAAVNCEKKDRAKIEALIRKMNKLINRASRKIRNLDDEQALSSRQKKAQQAKQDKRAAEMRDELRKRKMERMMREQRYLREAAKDPTISWDPAQGFTGQGTASEAEIAAEAEAIAAAEVVADVGGGELGAEVAAGGEGAGADAGGGGEVAVE